MAASASRYKPPRTDFGQPPPGYVPGLGRGATGFTTRSDIGPARMEVAPEAGPAAGPMPAPAAGAAAAPPGAGRGRGAGDADKGDYSDATFDQFSGFNERLFSGGTYDEDDREADDIFDAVADRMDSRRRTRREKQEEKEREQARQDRPGPAELFRGAKRELAQLTEDEWMGIPEPLDYSRQNKIRKKEREKAREKFTPVPDSAIASALGPGYAGVLDAKDQLWGGQTPAGTATPMNLDLNTLREVKIKTLSIGLDRAGDSVSGQTVVDPKGYLTDMNAKKGMGSYDTGDIKKAKQLIDSLLKTNPFQPEAWIAAARLEAETGKMSRARELILEGTKKCPRSEDIWLEAARLHDPPQAKALLAKAVEHVRKSVRIWLTARDLEQDPEKRKAVLRRALDEVPNSVKLWKAAVEQEEVEDARILLSRAVECVPESVEMWLALARLESYENAKKVLNRARAAVPKDISIWIAAAKLEETGGNVENVEPIIQACIRTMQQGQVVIERDQWLTEAENAERGGAKSTCQAIVKSTIGLGVDELDQRNIWMNDAQQALARGSIESARAIYAHTLATYPSKVPIWQAAAQLEKQYGTRDTLDALLDRAVTYCPRAENLWLMRAKEKWLAGDVVVARSILAKAFEANPDSEDVWLAAIKLESENREYERARLLLLKAREKAGTAHVYMKSALLERQLHNTVAEEKLLTDALAKFPTYPKLWMMMGQFHVLKTPPDVDSARKVLEKGTVQCPGSVDLWLVRVDVEVRYAKQMGKARAVLEAARLKNPKDAKLWLASIRVEQRSGNAKVAEQLIAKALQECPNSGILWAHAIASDIRPQRKTRSYDALKKCEDDPHVFLSIAKLFWTDRKIGRARDWFDRAITVNPDLGDAWVFYLKFETQHGTPEQQQSLIKRCVDAAPRHGELWVSVSKDPLNERSLTTEEVLHKAMAKIQDLFQLWFD